jgi:hypothetical protein
MRRLSFETVRIPYARKAADGNHAVSCGGMQCCWTPGYTSPCKHSKVEVLHCCRSSSRKGQCARKEQHRNEIATKSLRHLDHEAFPVAWIHEDLLSLHGIQLVLQAMRLLWVLYALCPRTGIHSFGFVANVLQYTRALRPVPAVARFSQS